MSYPELVPLFAAARLSWRALILRKSSALLFFSLSLFSFRETSLDLRSLQLWRAVSRIICLDTLSELATSGMQALSSSKATLSSFLRCRSMWLWISLASTCLIRRLSSFLRRMLFCIWARCSIRVLFTWLGEVSLLSWEKDDGNVGLVDEGLLCWDFEVLFLMMWNFCCFSRDREGSVDSLTLTQNLASPPPPPLDRLRIFLSNDWEGETL